MFNRHRLSHAASALALLSALGAGSARAADAPSSPTADQTPANEIVVVGASSAAGQRKQDAAYAITTVSEQAIVNAAPTSSADLVKLVPGLFAETTGGVSGPNIEVRGFPTAGDAPFVSLQLNGLPIYPVSSLSFLDNSTQFRLDDTIKRFESTIGGPAVLWGSAQPGATLDFIEKNGKTDPGGLLRGSAGNGGLYRVDGYFGGQIADGWYGSVGGFYRTDTGIRDTQFPADQGYQFVATLTHDIEDGQITLYGRITKDQNAFFTPIPLVSNNAQGTSISGYPGFDPLTATFIGNANRIVTFDVAPGGVSQTVDLGDGRGISNRVIGLDFTKSAGAVTFTNKLSYIWGDAKTVAQFTGANPQTLQSFIDSEVAKSLAAGPATPAFPNGSPLLGTTGVAATGGTATFVGGAMPITDLTQPVIGVGVWYVDKQLSAFQDEARVSFKLSDNNTLTAGLYFADYTSKDLWHLGNNQVMTVRNNATPIAITLNNGVMATNADGIYAPSFFSVNNSYSGRNIAGIIADDWRITERLKINAGVRVENETIDATEEGITSGFIGANPSLQLYDYNASYLNGSSKGVHYSGSKAAYAVNADYRIAENFNAFLGFNHGYVMPTFDDIRSGVTQTTTVNQLQGGIKWVSSLYSLYLTGFYARFAGQPSQQILADGTIINYLTSSHTEGLEFQGAIRPVRHFEISAQGDYAHGVYTAGGPGITGNTVLRQPALQFRVTPSYELPTAYGPLKVFATVTYIGQRWGDPQNLQPLPRYATLDFGLLFKLKNRIDLELTGTNVTNSLGITEGNTRVLGSGVGAGGVFLGRPLFGAAYVGSIAYHF